MAKWRKYSTFNAMTAGLAVIGLVGALTIDNQLAVIKNDCFERLAIGNRLNDKDVYVSLELKTVPDCQRECTKEGDKCRSFSFGIGVKGNGSCELSTKVVKETVDLKPIGTVLDPEFDLYIKKLGCKIVVEQKPSIESHENQPDKFNIQDQDSNQQSYSQNQNVGDSYGSSSNNYRPQRPEIEYRPRPSQSDTQHVHTTLISIRPDPNRPMYTGLGPGIGYFDPNVSDKPPRSYRPDDRPSRPIGYEFDGKPVRPYKPGRPSLYDDRQEVGYGERPFSNNRPQSFDTHRYDNFDDRYGRPRPTYYDDPRPPFRPSSLNHPYNDKSFFRPAPGDYDPGPTRPLNNDIGYNDPNTNSDRPRPGYSDRVDFDIHSIPPRRPNRPDGYNDEKDRPPVRRPGLDIDRFHPSGNKPSNERPELGYDSDRPNPVPSLNRPRPLNEGYDSGPKPSIVERPILDRPLSGYDRPDYDRPNPRPPIDRPRPMDNGYQNKPDSDRPNPHPPLDRPRPLNDGYQGSPNADRDERPGNFRPDIDRPNPHPHLDRPRPINDGYGNRPKPIHEIRPSNDFPGYNEPPKDRPGYDKPPIDRPGYDRPEFDKPPNDRPGYDRPPNNRPGYDRPSPNNRPGYDRPDFDRPKPDMDRPRPIQENIRPERPGYDIPEIDRPSYESSRPDFDRPRPGYDNDRPGYGAPSRPRPGRPTNDYDRPGYDQPRPEYNDRPKPSYDRPDDGYNAESINKPINYDDPNNPNSGYSHTTRPLSDSYNDNRRGDNIPEVNKNNSKRNNGSDANHIQHSPRPENPHEKPKPIITHSIGPHGEMITAIITELEPACYRRALAGKRVTRSLVRRALPCERIEDCQQECADEKRFVCEGFNYRLDPTGRGNGDCELLDLPMVRLDMIRDIYTDPDYDVYEKDRNASPSCKGYRPPGLSLYGGDRFRDREFSRDRYDSDRRFDRGPYYDRDRRPSSFYDDRRIADRRGDGYYYSDRNDYSYLPKPLNQLPYLPKRPYDEHQVKNYYDRNQDRNHWGFNKGSDWGSYGGTYGTFGKPDYNYGTVHRIDISRHHYYQPSRVGGTSDWGRYGGSYGNGGNSFGTYHGNSNKVYSGNGIPAPYDIPAGDTYVPIPNKGSYLPKYDRPTFSPYIPDRDNNYDSHKQTPISPKPSYDDEGYDYPKPTYGLTTSSNNYGNNKPTFDSNTGYNYPKPTSPSYVPSASLDPLEHKKFSPHPDHVGYNFLKDECSLRTATGFKLHKLAVRKYLSVPNIYDCEILCFKEKDFECLSYSYRYTVSSNLPTDNCYLSGKSFKELDYYTDLEPDRDFDIYTMNNRKKCLQSHSKDHEYSECFWHTRSGQSFDPKIIQDAVNVKNIVECQLECIKAVKFLCRGFSFRYGSPVIGGPAENCHLINWPFSELDRRTHFVPEPGFEIYERGSFGHGCEPNHFSIRGKDQPVLGSKTDQLCYVGYGSPARLLPQAIRKSVFTNTELDCKTECSKTRHHTLFQCMSFSYRNNINRGDTNCDLSDILQRDLLTDIDYVNDPDSWLFAWDNFNPECTSIIDANHISGHSDHSYESRDGVFDLSRYGGYNPITAMDTWRVYSVSGWPCKRGSLCRQNKIGGFWYCELEGGNSDTWDYCCRPDHQCGYSAGYSYQWCYVGPARSQWRKCSEQYFPYIFNLIDRHDYTPQFKPRPYIPSSKPSYGEAPPFIIGKPSSDSFVPPSNRPNHPQFRPNRPSVHHTPQRRPSLNDYEQQFNIHFLDPPKPGGFGQPRYWPVSYLHNESPPDSNTTEPRSQDMKMSKEMEEENTYAAIQNLIDIIKSNEINNIQYEIENKTTKKDDILLVKIPLPTNFSDDINTTEKSNNSDDLSNPIDLTTTTATPERSTIVIKDLGNRVSKSVDSFNSGSSLSVRQAPVYRKGFVTRTNVTRHGRFI